MRFESKIRWPMEAAGIVLIALPIVFGRATTPAGDVTDIPVLGANLPLKRHLQRRAGDTIRAPIHAGQYARISVTSIRSDLTVSLSANRSPEKLMISVATGETRGFSLLAISEEEYAVEIRPDLTDDDGDYLVWMSELRPALQADQVRIQAESAFWQAFELANTQSAKSQKRAISELEEAARLWHSIEDDAGEATAFTKMADLLSNLSETQKALEYSNRALVMRKTIGDERGRAESLEQIGAAQFNLGDRKQALKFLEEALQASLASNSLRDEAHVLNDFGVVYAAMGDIGKSNDYLQQALLLHQQSGNKRDEASTLTSIGHNYAETGQLKEAIKTFEESLPILRLVHDRYSEAANLNDSARAKSAEGEKQAALDLYRQALEIEKAVGDRQGEANTVDNIGKIHEDLGDNSGALRNYEEASRIATAIADRQLQMVTKARIAKIEENSGNWRRALDNYEDSLRLAEAAKDKKWQAIILKYTANLRFTTGSHDLALSLYGKAIALQRDIRNRVDLTDALVEAGQAHAVLNQDDGALALYTEALDISRDIGDSGAEARALFGIASIHSKAGNYADACPLLQSAVEKIDSLRGELATQNLRTSYSATVRDYFELYIDALMQLHRISGAEQYASRALEASEHSRARSTLELLSRSHVDFSEGVDRSLAEKEHELSYRLALYSERRMRAAARDSEPDKLRQLSARISELEAQYADVQASIRRTSPQYASLTEPKSLTAVDIQREIVNTDTTVLEYFLGKRRSFLWVIDRDGNHGFALAGREEIERTARQFYLVVSRRVAQVQGRSGREIASQLSRLILAPAAKLLGAKHLIVIPDGALEFIPFAALPAPAPGDTGLLLTKHEITYEPSVTVLSTLRSEAQKRVAPQKLVAVFADPVFSKEDPRLDREHASTRVTRSRLSDASLERSVAQTIGSETRAAQGLPRLAFSRMEAEWICSLASAKQTLKALDFDANLSAATGPQLREYRIVHFATHGLLNTEDPMLSGLVLSLFDKNGRPQPGFLKMSDLYKLKLSADLVVLSACQTGLGKYVNSEGLVGLTRGFMYAGADRVLASVWNVNDLATAELMKSFYESMFKQHLSPAAALRKAQIALSSRPERNSPYYWAGFLLQGDWN